MLSGPIRQSMVPENPLFRMKHDLLCMSYHDFKYDAMIASQDNAQAISLLMFWQE